MPAGGNYPDLERQALKGCVLTGLAVVLVGGLALLGLGVIVGKFF